MVLQFEISRSFQFIFYLHITPNSLGLLAGFGILVGNLRQKIKKLKILIYTIAGFN